MQQESEATAQAAASSPTAVQLIVSVSMDCFSMQVRERSLSPSTSLLTDRLSVREVLTINRVTDGYQVCQSNSQSITVSRALPFPLQLLGPRRSQVLSSAFRQFSVATRFFPVMVQYDVTLQAYSLEAPEGSLIEVGFLPDEVMSCSLFASVVYIEMAPL